MRIDYVYVEEELRYCKGFIEVYKEAFGGHPYYEVYTNREVFENIWKPHLDKGIIVLACDNGCVVGFGCAKPLFKSDKEIQSFLEKSKLNLGLSIELSKTWYISELGVHKMYRRQGIGLQLVGQCIAHISDSSCSYYVMRTAAKDSNSIGLFKNIGAIEVSGTQDVSESDQIQINKSKSTKRVYLYGRCEEALRRISVI